MITIISIVSLVLGIILILYGIKEKKVNNEILDQAHKEFEKAESIKLIKNFQNEQAETNYQILQKQIEESQNKKDNLEQDIRNLYKQTDAAIQELKQQYIDREEDFQVMASAAADQYFTNLEQSYDQAEAAFNDKINALEKEKDIAVEEVQKIKDFLSAGVQAKLREEEKKDKLNFYKITLSQNDLDDIRTLERFKSQLHNPVILSKLIWTTYFQKLTKELCGRILGTNQITGIYKITNINTEKVYIGQAVDVAKRWTDHIKCGLGIDTPSTVRLYKDMKEYGVWNYTFELLEQCSRESLNEKEKQWIELYQSNIYGLNTQGGNK